MNNAECELEACSVSQGHGIVDNEYLISIHFETFPSLLTKDSHLLGVLLSEKDPTLSRSGAYRAEVLKARSLCHISF